MICPRCQQDDVIKAMIKANKSIVFICPECESTWFSIDEIKFPGFVDYMTYMSSIGLSHLWDELEIISEKI
ncbi:TFIIB-like protein [Pseudomonas sp. IT-P2]